MPGADRWTPQRPHTLVIACSDGRLEDATDSFLHDDLGLAQFDRFYVPGGGGALASSGRDYIRAQQLRRECQYLIELHQVGNVILLFHGPTADGPAESVCADYRRKLPWASPAQLYLQQLQDAAELHQRRAEWAGEAATIRAFRCEVDADRKFTFRDLEDDPSWPAT